MLSLPSNQKRKRCREVNSWEARGGHWEGRSKKEWQRQTRRGRAIRKRSEAYLKKKITVFCWKASDKLKACSVLGRQLGWGEGIEEAQCLEQVCKNVTVTWFTILTWKILTVGDTAHNKEFGKSCALTCKKPALQAPGSSYSTNILTEGYVQKVLQQK